MHTKQCGLAVYNCLFTDTACILCDRVYVTIRCPSVCLSSFARCSACGGFAAVGPAVGRYRSTAAVAQQHGVQQQMRAMSCWDPRYEDQHRLTWFIINFLTCLVVRGLLPACLISPGVSVPIQVPGGGSGPAAALFDDHNSLTSHYWSSRP